MKRIAIYYEHPRWFEPLFQELDRRGTDYIRLDATRHFYDPAQDPRNEYSVVFNRMSPSAWNRGHGDAIFYTQGFLDYLEHYQVRVINGSKAFRSELSKAAQLTMLEALGLPYPKSRVIHRASEAVEAANGLRLPIVVKPNIGGSGAGVKRFNSIEELSFASGIQAAAQRSSENDGLEFGLDSTALVQEFIPAREQHIVRVEVLNGKYLYAIKVHITGETFDLCPADICKTTTGVALSGAACTVEASKAGLTVERFDPPADAIADVERIMQHAGIEIGGVEYMTDDRDGQRYYYDINALSNFVSDGKRSIGFDPFVRLVDWLELSAKAAEDGSGNRAAGREAVPETLLETR